MNDKDRKLLEELVTRAREVVACGRMVPELDRALLKFDVEFSEKIVTNPRATRDIP